MLYFTLARLFTLMFMLTTTASFADEDSDKIQIILKSKHEERVPEDASNGPPEPYMYRNASGIFKLSKGSTEGATHYVRDGKRYTDTLIFLGLGEITDPTGIGIDQKSTYDVWLYESSSANGKRKCYFALGVDTMRGPDVPPGHYGVYFSRQDPLNGGTLKRWLTLHGTSRE